MFFSLWSTKFIFVQHTYTKWTFTAPHQHFGCIIYVYEHLYPAEWLECRRGLFC